MGNIKLLEKHFEGIGEMQGYKFNQICISLVAYCYEITKDGINPYYEVFKRKNTPICINFEKRIYSETEFKEKYPKSEDFGNWAWCFKDKNLALKKFINIFENKEFLNKKINCDDINLNNNDDEIINFVKS